MSDDPAKPARPDRTHIHTDQLHELRYWSTKFGVRVDELLQAVRKAGTAVKDVQRELARRGVLGGGDGLRHS